jgi:hypothetical protein
MSTRMCLHGHVANALVSWGGTCLLATSAGYGFIVKLGELQDRNRAGKAVL